VCLLAPTCIPTFGGTFPKPRPPGFVSSRRIRPRPWRLHSGKLRRTGVSETTYVLCVTTDPCRVSGCDPPRARALRLNARERNRSRVVLSERRSPAGDTALWRTGRLARAATRLIHRRALHEIWKTRRRRSGCAGCDDYAANGRADCSMTNSDRVCETSIGTGGRSPLARVARANGPSEANSDCRAGAAGDITIEHLPFGPSSPGQDPRTSGK